MSVTSDGSDNYQDRDPTPPVKLPACSSQSPTPLHSCPNRTSMLRFITDGLDVNSTNILGETPLHAHVMRNNFDLSIALLSRNADLSRTDYKGNTALHAAVFYDAKLIIVKALVVFGANTTVKNKNGDSPLSIVQGSMRSKKREDLLAVLSFGAGTTVHAQPNNSQISEVRRSLRNELLAQGKLDEDEQPSVQGPPPPPRRRKKKENVLCLDGGGMRGMILIQLLMAIEEQLDKPIVEYFDWISGTSTGGILALCLAKRYTVKECLALYFRMKDAVFSGRRPYKPEPLEDMLKELFGENTLMNSVERPKLLISACMADQLPLNLHFFRNYQHPQAGKSAQNIAVTQQCPRKMEDDYNTQLMWKAGRATGAAPTYFRSYTGYLDGGLIANNPTLDTLTEIFDYFNHLKKEGLPDQLPELGVVLSLGTGISPSECITHFDIYRPETFQELKTAPKILMGFSTLGRMIITQATDTDGRVVDRSRTWCQSVGVPFFRFSPCMSRYVQLDCTDDETLIEALWETRLYAASQVSKMKRVSDLLRR